jgi:hypothetical protein
VVRPVVWRPPAEPSPAELAVNTAVRRAKLFVFLQLHRHELFDAPSRPSRRGPTWTAQRANRRCSRPGWRWRRSCRPIRGVR